MFPLVSRRRFAQIEVLEGLNVLACICGKQFVVLCTCNVLFAKNRSKKQTSYLLPLMAEK